MRIYTAPERYQAIVEAAIARALSDIERDRLQPGWVAPFGIDESRTGTLVIMVAGVSEAKLAKVGSAA